jgi:two-component system response regulator AtoC
VALETGREPVGQGRLQMIVFTGEDVHTRDLPPEGHITIGRGEKNNVRIDDPSVSRQHAILHVGDGLHLEDLGSANGTMIRERAESETAAETLNVRHLSGTKADLALGDTIVFGTVRALVRHFPVAIVPDLALPGGGVVPSDAAMRAVYNQAALVAPTPLPVLILGETGVGKEVLARAIHAHSARAQGPLVSINCAALSESLLESELFGHEKGAFTGAAQARAGLFEAASGGTVFLDEVGELSPATQAKLLRVLAERVVVRVGSTQVRPVDVRFIAATNRDLESDSRAGRFREDLFFRLNGISLTIPPLRDRQGEIDELARTFVAGGCRQIERTEIPRLSVEASALLHRHSWRGNVRELRHAMEHAVVLCLGGTILPEHLPAAVRRAEGGTLAVNVATIQARPETGPAPTNDGNPLPAAIRELERIRIVETLERCAGSQSEAARVLGISRRKLISRIEEYGLPRPRKSAQKPAS